MMKNEPVTIRLSAAPSAVAVAPPEQPLAPAGADAQLLAVRLARQDRTIADLRRQAESAREQCTGARDALEQCARELRDLKQQIVTDAEAQLVDLAISIARKVLMQEISAGRYEIEPIVSAALKHLPALDDVIVHLHPEDLAACSLGEDRESPAGDGVRFVADPSVQRANCVIETPEGLVASDVDDHLADISEALKNTSES